MSQPISNSLLVHTADYYSFASIDQWNKRTYSTTKIELSRIRVRPAKHLAVSQLGESKDDKLVLIFDKVNSIPNTVVFSQFDRIVYNGINYLVRTVESPSGDESGVHHDKVYLVGET